MSEGIDGYIVNGMIFLVSQRSLHDAPIFRLLLKVAVNGTHQCDFHNFCGASGLQQHMIDRLCAWLVSSDLSCRVVKAVLLSRHICWHGFLTAVALNLAG